MMGKYISPRQSIRKEEGNTEYKLLVLSTD